MDLNYLDFGLIAMILGFTYWGVREKSISAILSFIGIFLALFMAMESLEIVAPIFASTSLVSARTSLVLTLIIFLLITLFVYRYLENWLRDNIPLKIPELYNKIGGGILGALRGVFLVCIVTVSLAIFPLNVEIHDIVYNSRIREYAEPVTIKTYNMLSKLIPGSLTFIQTLEAATQEIGPKQFDADYFALLIDLDSGKAEKWMITAR